MQPPLTWLSLIILSMIQGFAELLPISSSAHVILAEKIMGINPSCPEMTFLLVMLHTGTMGSVLVFFWHQWKKHFQIQIFFPLFVSTAITGAVGLSLKKGIELFLKKINHVQFQQMEDTFKSLPLIAFALTCGSILILIASRKKPTDTPLTLQKACIIGLIQGFCLPFRGFSRSGATISTGLLLGLSFKTAEIFSFALAIAVTPAVITRECLKLWNQGPFTSFFSMALPGLCGSLMSFMAGLCALKLLHRLSERGSWSFFGFYSIFAAISLLVCHFYWQL